jgi:hypothetical protein
MPLIVASPLDGFKVSRLSIVKTSFRARGGSRSEVSAVGDRRKCQTYTASPAEPGGLPVMLVGDAAQCVSGHRVQLAIGIEKAWNG